MKSFNYDKLTRIYNSVSKMYLKILSLLKQIDQRKKLKLVSFEVKDQIDILT